MHLTINPNGGGAERVASLICKNMLEINIQSEVFSIDPLEQGEEPLYSYSLNTERKMIIVREISAAMRLRRALRIGGFTHLHIHCEAPELVAALATFQVNRLKIIVSEHTERPWIKFRFVGYLVRRNLLKKRAIFVNCSDFNKKWMQNDRSIQINNYIRDDVKQYEIESSKEKVNRIFLIQRLVETKRVKEVLLAIHAANAHFQIEVFGDGPEREKLQQFSNQMGLIVRFHGFNENPWQEFRPGTLIISGSDYEGNPMTVSEAIAVNAPILLRNIAGHKFAITNPIQGFDNFKELTERLADLDKGLLDSSSFQVANNVRLDFLKSRSLEVINSEWRAVYSQRGMHYE
jgi:glycosyltransferase involved in cell wall biosynthesis